MGGESAAPEELPNGRLRRFAPIGAAVLLGLHAVMLFLSVPLAAFLILSSGWEGGDPAFEHRLLAWGPIALLVAMVTGVLLIVAAVTVRRADTTSRGLLGVSSALLAGLGAGWAWVWRSALWSDATMLAWWAALTLPGIIAAALILTASRPAGPAPA